MDDKETIIPKSLKPHVRFYRRGVAKPRPSVTLFAINQASAKAKPAQAPKVEIQNSHSTQPKPAPPEATKK
jgi:hypothetical protein